MVGYRLLLALDSSVIKNVIVDGVILHKDVPENVKDFVENLIFKTIESNGCIYLYRCICRAYLPRREYYGVLEKSIETLYTYLEDVRNRYYSDFLKFKKLKNYHISQPCAPSKNSLSQANICVFEQLIIKVLQVILNLAFVSKQGGNLNWKICFIDCPYDIDNYVCKKLKYKYSNNHDCDICVNNVGKNLESCNKNIQTYVGGNATLNCLNNMIKKICYDPNYARCIEDLHVYLTPFCNTSEICLYDDYCESMCNLDYGSNTKCIWALTFGKCDDGDSICFPSNRGKTKYNITFICGSIITPIIRDNNISICFGIIYLCR